MMTAPSAPLPLSGTGRVVAVLAALLVAAVCAHLWQHWTDNPDLSHGLFAPVLIVALVHEARRRGPWRYLPASRALNLVRGLVLAVAVVLVGLGGAYAAALEWSHALVALCFTWALSLLLLGALLWFSADQVRILPFNWTSLVAIGFWPLCSPLPPGTYSRLTLHLQLWVTDIVLHTLHILGIAASKAGNVILLASTSVGVEEACSGVRSLISCFVAALFFSATLVQRRWARALLIALAPPLAFVMNVIRSLTLTLLANAGVDIKGTWHDVTGFAVLGVTAFLLGTIALWLEEPIPANPTKEYLTSPEPSRPWSVLTAYSAACALVLFFVLNTHGPRREAGAPPDLEKILPAAPAGWDLVKTEDLYEFSPILATDHLLQRTYLRRRTDGTQVELTVYVAYWAPGQARVASVAMHTPEFCWPGSGWITQPTEPAKRPFTVGENALAFPEYRRFSNNGDLRHVWYWHLYDGRSIVQTDPLSAVTLVKFAWRYGFSSAGEQFFVRISSNLPWSELRDEPLVADIVAPLRSHGL